MIRAQKSRKQGVGTPCELHSTWVRCQLEQGDLMEQSPEMKLGYMRGLGGSEQPVPSEAF